MSRSRINRLTQFSVGDLAVVVFFLAVAFAIGRIDHDHTAGKTFVSGSGLCLGGFVSLWSKRYAASIVLMLGGLGVILIGALICGRIP